MTLPSFSDQRIRFAKSGDSPGSDESSRADSPATTTDIVRWDDVLRPAAGATTPAAGASEPKKTKSAATNLANAPAQSPATPAARTFAERMSWVRALLPLAAVLAWILYTVVSRPPGPAGPESTPQAQSLTGVDPAAASLRMDRATKETVAQLEALQSRRNWSEIRTVISRAPAPQRAHPALQAFDAIARAELGEKSGQLREELLRLENLFEGRSDFEPLRDYLHLMRGVVLARFCTNPEIMLARMNEFRELLIGLRAESPRSMEFRIEMARRFEEFGDEELKAAGGFRKDVRRIDNARRLYQQGLRMVVKPQGWAALEPIRPGDAALAIDRLGGRLREANRAHNSADPQLGIRDRLTKGDSGTWTGTKGDPLHDKPGGVW